jgi:hypothetical protein
MNRYLKMQPSKVTDVDGETYYDPLSVSYGYSITKIPTKHIVDSTDIAKFWYYFYKRYGKTEGDDILLSRNSVPYIGMLKPGDTLYEFVDDDLNNITFQED